MHRRAFLALTGAGLAAGCLDGDGDSTTGEPSTQNTQAGTTGSTGGDSTTETTASGGTRTGSETANGTEPNTTVTDVGKGVEIREHRLRVDEGDSESPVGVLATVVNTGDAHSGRVTLEATFRDGDGNELATGESSVADLAPEETWAAYVPFPGDDAGAVASHELSGSVMENVPSFYHPNLSFAEFTLDVTDEEAYIRGTVENEGDEAVDFLQVNGYFHEERKVVLDSNTATTENLGAGESFSFEIASGMPAFRREQISTKTASVTTEPL